MNKIFKVLISVLMTFSLLMPISAEETSSTCNIEENDVCIRKIGYNSLEEAIEIAQENDVIKLNKTISLQNTLNVVGSKNITIDLNGNDLIFNHPNTNNVMMNIGNKEDSTDNTSLLLTNSQTSSGEIKSESSAAALCVRKGSSLITKDIKINFLDEDDKNSNVAIQVQGSLVVNENTIINSTEGGISVIDEGASLEFNGGEVEAEFYAISGNGTLSGTNITINDGTLIASNGSGIFHPQNGTLTLNGGYIEGLTGVQMCAGNLEIPDDSRVVVVATGEDLRGEKEGNDGPIDDGAAISVVNRNYPGGMPAINIKGGSFTSNIIDDAISAYVWIGGEGDKYKDWEDVSETNVVSGGIFSSDVSEYVKDKENIAQANTTDKFAYGKKSIESLSNQMNDGEELTVTNAPEGLSLDLKAGIDVKNISGKDIEVNGSTIPNGKTEQVIKPIEPQPEPEKPSKPDHNWVYRPSYNDSKDEEVKEYTTEDKTKACIELLGKGWEYSESNKSCVYTLDSSTQQIPNTSTK